MGFPLHKPYTYSLYFVLKKASLADPKHKNPTDVLNISQGWGHPGREKGGKRASLGVSWSNLTTSVGWLKTTN